MDTEQEQLKAITEIRSMMERSSRFISLSGMSGVSAGIFALIGAIVAFFYLNLNIFSDNYYSLAIINSRRNPEFILFFFTDASIVLILSLIFGIYFTTRNAKRKGLKIWNKTTELTLINLFVPLSIGGVFCFVLLYHYLIFLIAPTMLVFYGLALINASKYTLNEIRYLGYVEAGIGLLACFFVGYGLIAWAIGFGLLHIIYGLVMYYKYEK
jgi:hypothetical protein